MSAMLNQVLSFLGRALMLTISLWLFVYTGELTYSFRSKFVLQKSGKYAGKGGSDIFQTHCKETKKQEP